MEKLSVLPRLCKSRWGLFPGHETILIKTNPSTLPFMPQKPRKERKKERKKSFRKLASECRRMRGRAGFYRTIIDLLQSRKFFLCPFVAPGWLRLNVKNAYTIEHQLSRRICTYTRSMSSMRRLPGCNSLLFLAILIMLLPNIILNMVQDHFKNRLRL